MKRALSLFAGIGGLEKGLETAGVCTTVAQCEIEPFPRSVLARHWPEAERFEDVRTLTAADVGEIDLICGGFPCQPWSAAGKRKGREDERHLWPDFARLVRELRPAWVVGENVSALLSGGIGEPLADLSAAGYDVTWDCVPAAAVGAPHRRDRVFILAWRRDVCAPPLDVSEAWARAVRTVRERYGASNGDGGSWLTPNVEDGGREGDDAWAARWRNGETPPTTHQRLRTQIKAWPGWPAGPWPTPAASLHNDSEDPSSWLARCEEFKKTAGNGNGAGIPLAIAAKLGTMWPAGPRQPQHAWEPPRTAKGVADRAKRLRALGNAVVPQAAEAVGLALRGIADGVGSDSARPVVARLVGSTWQAPQGGLFDAPEVTRFPRAGTVRGGVAYELVPCAPLSSLAEGGWYTPTSGLGMSDSAANANPTPGMAARCDRGIGNLLEQIAREFWPTPCASEARQGFQDRSRGKQGSQESLSTVVMKPLGGAGVAPLNPAWVETLMGLPVGWTEADALPARSGNSSRRPPAEAVASRGVQRLAAGAMEVSS